MSGTFCTDHRESVADDSPRGRHYPDDRTELAYVYDGESLRAILFDEEEVDRYREKTSYHVGLTPAGECRIDGRCRDQPDLHGRSLFGRVVDRIRRALDPAPGEVSDT